jgi:hypothetical protein
MSNKHLIVLYIIITLYIVLSQIFAMYFWFLYAQNHGFIATLIIGPIVGEIKGLLFPFFI